MKLVSIVTVNFNQAAVTEALLDSIAATNNYAQIEIIVVDNGSKTDAVPAWKKMYPKVNFIRSEKNLGFAGGNNLGIQQARGEYLFLVNNDTEFTPGLIEKLVDVLEKNPSIGMASPKIRYYDEPSMLQYMGYTKMNYFTASNHCVGQFEIDNGQYDHLTGETGYVHGAAMMIKRECVEKAGLMAENFFLYYEELDWCDHIKRAGYKAWLVSDALIYHKDSISVGKASALKEFFMNRNRILFIRRNANIFQKLVFYCYYLSLVAPRNILRYVRNGQKGFTGWLLKAIWWNVQEKQNSNNLGYPITR